MASTFSSSGSPAPRKTPGWGGYNKSPLANWQGPKLTGPKTSYTPAPVAPVKTAPAATFDVNNLPPDPGYDQSYAGLKKKRDDRISADQGQRTGTLLEYGYTEDPSGALTFDPSNPYSQAALAKRTYDIWKAGTTTSMAARGQFSSGAYVNAQNENDHRYSVADNAIRLALGKFLAANTADQTAAGTDFETDAGGLMGERISRAQDNPLYSSSPETPPPPPATATIQNNLGGWVTTTYTNPQGHKVRVFGDGHKEVFVNGVWRRV